MPEIPDQTQAEQREERRSERVVERRHLYTAFAVSYTLLFIGILGLGWGLRSEGITRHRGDEKHSEQIDLAICRAQNDLRESIRDFVKQLSDDPATESAVDREFKDIPCIEIVNGKEDVDVRP